MVDVGGLNGVERSPLVFEEKQIRRKNVAWLKSLDALVNKASFEKTNGLDFVRRQEKSIIVSLRWLIKRGAWRESLYKLLLLQVREKKSSVCLNLLFGVVEREEGHNIILTK